MITNAKYVVFNENTLGVSFTSQSGIHSLMTLHASILRGATHNPLSNPLSITSDDTIREATLTDFNDYRCCVPPNFPNINFYNDVV